MFSCLSSPDREEFRMCNGMCMQNTCHSSSRRDAACLPSSLHLQKCPHLEEREENFSRPRPLPRALRVNCVQW